MARALITLQVLFEHQMFKFGLGSLTIDKYFHSVERLNLKKFLSDLHHWDFEKEENNVSEKVKLAIVHGGFPKIIL